MRRALWKSCDKDHFIAKICCSNSDLFSVYFNERLKFVIFFFSLTVNLAFLCISNTVEEHICRREGDGEQRAWSARPSFRSLLLFRFTSFEASFLIVHQS